MKKIDVLIVGAGPAGLQLGYFLQRDACSYAMLEATDQVASFFRRMPRSRQLISFNKVHSLYTDEEIRLRWDWNALLTDDYSMPFREFSEAIYPHADDLVRYLEEFRRRNDIEVHTSTRVTRVQRSPQGGFEVDDERGGRWLAKIVVVATGFAEPYVPEIPGIELCEGYETMDMEARAFRGQRVLIIGKGNSAFEVADSLLDHAALLHLCSPEPVELAWKTRHPGHLRAHYTRLLDSYQLKTLNGVLDADLLGIVRDGSEYVATVSYLHADGEVEDLVYDRVIRATGFTPSFNFLDESMRPEMVLDGRLPAIKPDWESSNIPGLFFAGTLMQALDFKRASSAFIDGFRYNIRTLHHLLQRRLHGTPYPSLSVPADPQSLSQALLRRCCRTSALWAQFGYLCDLLVFDEDERTLQWQQERSIYQVELECRELEHYYTLTFEWGEWSGDVFNITRHPSADRADTNVFLHPILRRYRRGELQDTHHVLEDLFGVYAGFGESGVVRRRSGRDMATYHRQEHEEPLRAFLERQLTTREPAPLRSTSVSAY